MELQTKHLGKQQVEENQIITFEDGILGFEEYKKYALLTEESIAPLWTLQSIEEPGLAFLLMSPFEFKQDYAFQLATDDIENLEITDQKEVMVFSIIVMKEGEQEVTANLQAPVIINIENGNAKQIILQENYSMKHKIF